MQYFMVEKINIEFLDIENDCIFRLGLKLSICRLLGDRHIRKQVHQGCT